MDNSSLSRRIAETEDAYSAFGCDLVDFGEYEVIKYADCMYGWNVNQVRDINYEKGNSQNLIHNIECAMGWPYRQFCVYTDFRTRPQEISYALRQAGYRPIPLLTQVFVGKKLKKAAPCVVVPASADNMNLWQDFIVSMYAQTDRGEIFARDMKNFGISKLSTITSTEDFMILLCIKENMVVGQAEVYTRNGVTSIGNIYVRPKYRKNGIATNLIYEGIDRANSLSSDVIYLVTYSFDTPRYAYVKMGFEDLLEGMLWAKFDDDQFDMIF